MLVGAIVSLILAITVGNLIMPSLLPYGPAAYIPRKVYPKFTPLDLKNDRLRSSSKCLVHFRSSNQLNTENQV